MTSSRPSFLRFLLAFALAPLLVGGAGLAMMATRVPGIDGIGMIIAVSMICGAPSYFLAGGPMAWKAVNQGPPNRRDAVIWGLLANFASLILAPLTLWLVLKINGPLQIDPELARQWAEASPTLMETRWQPLIYGAFVFLLGIVFAPFYALAAHAFGRWLKVNPPVPEAPLEGGAAQA